MPTTAPLLQALRDLGLTATEAEVYVATLEAAAEGPVSGYRVAQGLGRDPANLAKVMAGLVRQGAVRVVQEKPRLFLPVAPAAFTEAVVHRLRDRRDQALDLLRAFAPAEPGGAPLLVATFADALAAAAGLVAGATGAVHLHASPDVVAALAEPLAAAAARPGCRVAVLSPAPAAPRGCELTLVPAPGDGAPAWLHLVCDRTHWLVARAGAEPAGCGAAHAAVAAVLADGLDVARRAGGLQADLAALGAAAGEPALTPRPAPAAPAPAGRGDDGLTFLIKHDRKRD
ncbi:MAG: helix-turn-helix domain-containing protein [Candidatus Krumholzibacteriia bacterium]